MMAVMTQEEIDIKSAALNAEIDLMRTSGSPIERQTVALHDHFGLLHKRIDDLTKRVEWLERRKRGGD